MTNLAGWISKSLSILNTTMFLSNERAENYATSTLLKRNTAVDKSTIKVDFKTIELDEKNICCEKSALANTCTVYDNRNDPRIKFFDFDLNQNSKTKKKELVVAMLSTFTASGLSSCKTCFYREGLNAIFDRVKFASLEYTIKVSTIVNDVKQKVELIGLRDKFVFKEKEYKRLALLALDVGNTKYLVSRKDRKDFELIQLVTIKGEDSSKKYQKDLYEPYELKTADQLLKKSEDGSNKLVIENLIIGGQARLSSIPLDSFYYYDTYDGNGDRHYNFLSRNYEKINKVYEEEFPEDAELAGIRTTLKKNIEKKDKVAPGLEKKEDSNKDEPPQLTAFLKAVIVISTLSILMLLKKQFSPQPNNRRRPNNLL